MSSTLRRLIQLTPAYPPDVSGVGDYAALLGKALRDMGLPLETFVADGSAHPEGDARALERAESGSLAEALGETERVLLHFSGYGYARRGLCGWLVDGLQRWKAAGDRDWRLVTMFHEVCATGPIWRSSFWTAGPQRRIARDLARLSDAGFVSSRGGLQQLARLAPGLKMDVLPVFSNMGEPEEARSLAARARRAVVFGGRTRRQRVYDGLGHAGRAFAQRLAELGVTEVIDIGPAVDVPEEIGGCPIKSLGPRPAHEVSAALGDARIGLIDYPGHVFTKSGIAAAYFAHRLAIVNTSAVGGFPPDLEEGRHFLGLQSFLSGDFETQAIADAGHDWYRPHGVAAAAEQFRLCLE